MTTINLSGWTHVHTWYESHGVCQTDFYQKEQPEGWRFERQKPQVLTVTTYYRNGQHTDVGIETGRDYLKAREIKANPDRFVLNGNQHTDPCCTAGYDDYRDTQTDEIWRVAGVAGHGKWAFEVKGGE